MTTDDLIRTDSGDVTRIDRTTELLKTLVGSFDGEERTETLLQRLCEQLVEVIPDADMASVTVIRDGNAATAACTDARVHSIDADQYDVGDGPCLRAADTGEVVRVDLGEAKEKWPRFAELAGQVGVASYLSAPLCVDDVHAGAINLYSEKNHGYREVEAALLELVVAWAESVLRTNARYRAARELADNLEIALVSRAGIDQAKGVLMADHGVSADEAFAALTAQSQNQNVKVGDLARQIIESTARRRGEARRTVSDAGGEPRALG